MKKICKLEYVWIICATVDSHYAKVVLNEQMYYLQLQKAEDRVTIYAVWYNHLISMYAPLKIYLRWWDCDDRWKLLASGLRTLIIISNLVKLSVLEEAEGMYKGWQSTGRLFVFCVPNV